MTNRKDLAESGKYHYLTYAEFLDFLGRVALSHGKAQLLVDRWAPRDIEDQVYALLELVWDYRMKHKPVVAQKARKGKKKKPEEFPELVPVTDLDVDSD